MARDGDVVEIAGGTYRGDVATWTASRLTLRGVGQVALDADGKSAQGKAIWVIAGNQTTVENIAFVGARVADRNGAGIRQEGAGLVVRRCVFSANENGILAGENRQSDILVERSTFVGNGAGDGYSHNIYISTVRSFTLRSSVSRDARVGHEVKSRALRNDIRYNRIDDGPSGASYSIDLPNGGDATIVGNLIVQGVSSQNSGVISYGAEGHSNAGRRLRVASNTILNRLTGDGVIVHADAGTEVAIVGNALFGGGTLVDVPALRRANHLAPTLPRQVRPRRGSPLIDAGATVAPDLAPRLEPGGDVRRIRGRVDIGAYEAS